MLQGTFHKVFSPEAMAESLGVGSSFVLWAR